LVPMKLNQSIEMAYCKGPSICTCLWMFDIGALS
jgi:hypothetical protein